MPHTAISCTHTHTLLNSHRPLPHKHDRQLDRVNATLSNAANGTGAQAMAAGIAQQALGLGPKAGAAGNATAAPAGGNASAVTVLPAAPKPLGSGAAGAKVGAAVLVGAAALLAL